jgi:hypothetical protein
VQAAPGERVATAGVGGEEAVVADHVEAARRDECAQTQKQLAGRETEHMPPVREAALHCVEDRTIGRLREPALSERRTERVAGKPLETLAVVLVDGDASVEGEAVLASAP